MKLFRGGFVFKAHGLVYHLTLGWRVIKKKKKRCAHQEDLVPRTAALMAEMIMVELMLCG